MIKILHILLYSIMLLALLVACDKQYSYVEYGSNSLTPSEDESVIKAPNDTTAYLKAFQKFCISLKTYQDLQYRAKEVAEYLTLPESFKLYNPRGEEITNIDFSTRAMKEQEIFERIISLELEGGTPSKRETFVIDSLTVAELSPYFSIKKEEFSNDEEYWYTPKSAPKYINRNGLYCYFQTTKGIAENFRFVLQYYADDWLFIRSISFLVDDNVFDFKPYNMKRDHEGGMIWEWFDERISNKKDKELIKALANCKTAKMRLYGSDYRKDKEITSNQLLDIKRAYDLYIALGGQL